MPRRVLTSKPGLLAPILLLAVLWPAGAVAAPSDDPGTGCGADEVTVVVDFNELGGAQQSVCVSGEGTATQLFDRGGFPTEEARGTALQGFVCRVAGKPADGPCTDGDAYWSLWWSEPGAEPDWAYATLGADQLEVAPGSWIGFAWHQGDGSAAPPDVATQGGAPPAGADRAAPAEDGSGVPWWPLLGGAVVLAAAAIVPIRRSRS